MSNVNKSTEIKIITRLLSKNAFDNYTLNKMHVQTITDVTNLTFSIPHLIQLFQIQHFQPWKNQKYKRLLRHQIKINL